MCDAANTCDCLESAPLSLEPIIAIHTVPIQSCLIVATMTPRAQRPRRRQQLLGLTKKRVSRKQKQADPTAPTDEEFATSKTFKSARGEKESLVYHRDVLALTRSYSPRHRWQAARVFYRRRVGLHLKPSRRPTSLTLSPTSVLVVPSGKDPNIAHLLADTENWVAKIQKIACRSNGEVGALNTPVLVN